MLAQKQSDQTVVRLVERLRSQGYEVHPNAARRGRSGVDHTFDYLVLRRDGFTNLLAAVEVINDAEDPEASLHRLFAFQDKCGECGVSRSVVIAIPRLSFVASQFAQKDGVEVFDEQALQMFLSRAPAAHASPADAPKTFLQKSEVHQALKTLGYRVDETVRVTGESGTERLFGAMALWDDGFVLSRLGIDYLYSDTVDRTEISAFDDKCRDAGITEKMLLIPKGLTEEAKKLAQEKRIEVISLDGRLREVVPEGIEPAPSPSQKPGSNGSRPGSPDAARQPEAAAQPPVPPPESSDKPADRKKTIVVSEVKPAKPAMPPPAAGREASPPADKAAPATPPNPTTPQAGGNPVFAPLEPPARAKQFTMRSVIDQFLGPQVRPRPPEKTPAPAAATPAASAREGPGQPSVPDRLAGAAAPPVAAAPGVTGAKGPDARASETRPPGDKTAPATEKPDGAENQPPATKPGSFVAKPVILPLAKPLEAKAVLVADRPEAQQAKASDNASAAKGAVEAPKATAPGGEDAKAAPGTANGKPATAAVDAKAAPGGADVKPATGAADAKAAQKTETPKEAEGKGPNGKSAPSAPGPKAAEARAPDDVSASKGAADAQKTAAKAAETHKDGAEPAKSEAAKTEAPKAAEAKGPNGKSTPKTATAKGPNGKTGPIAAAPRTGEAKAAPIAAAAKIAEVLNAAVVETGEAEAPDGASAPKAAPEAQATAAAGEPQKGRPAVPGKAGQANALPAVGRVPAQPKPPSGDRDAKQGVVGPPNAVAGNAQYLKPTLEKGGVDKRQGLAAKAKLPEKPTEPPKPVVEEVVEKPKVKLSKAARPEALQAIPESTARRFTVLPISVNDNILEVAMLNPSDLATIQVLELQSKMRVKAVGAEEKEIRDAIDFNYKGFGQIAEQISHIETAADAAQGIDLVASTANAPVAAALNMIVEEAVKARASDIHIEPEEKRLRVRYRIDGVLQEVMSLPIKIHPPLTSRVKVMSDLNIADHLRPQDGQFSLEVKGKAVDVRVATSPTVHGETVVMRILDKSMAMMELPQLGFQEDCLARYMKMLAVPFGMICVSGPTGAGKTTTLYASLNTMDKVTRNIITAEDPVEYRFEGIKQIQVNPKAGLTFASVLRSMMRLDPDVILVGEIRDAETASIAVKAALTGHTVLCSIHANDAVSVVYRLLDLGVEAFMVASVITGTLAQRMARRVCTNCAVETKPTEVEAAAYESVMGEKLESFVSGTGCDLCNFSGYKGRLGLYEILAMTDTTRAMVLKGATTTELRNQAVKEGMVTLFKDGMQKVKAGKTTVSEVMRNAYSIE